MPASLTATLVNRIFPPPATTNVNGHAALPFTTTNELRMRCLVSVLRRPDAGGRRSRDETLLLFPRLSDPVGLQPFATMRRHDRRREE
jgi:hypothetical protein